MRFSFLFACAVVAALLLSGCSKGPNQDTGTTAMPTGFAKTQSDAVAAHPSIAGWTLDCTLGAPENAVDATWIDPCVARASHTQGSKEEMWLAVNPTDPLNVVVGSKDLNPDSSPSCVWNGLGVTHDGGKTWKDVTVGGKFADRQVGDPFFGYDCNTDPDFRFTSEGDLHYSVEMYGLCGGAPAEVCSINDHSAETAGWKIILATSHDGGDTFPDVITYQPDIVLTTDYSRMQRSPTTDTVLEAIGSEGGVGCNVLRWNAATDPAATFEPVVTKDGIPCNSGGGSGVAASPTGTFLLIGAAGVVARSTDDGVSFTDSNALFTWNGIPGQFAESQYRITDNVETAYDWSMGAHKGTLYATYAASDRSGDQADIFVRSSTDDGKTWSEAVLVNADAPGAHQWMPNIAVADDGSIHVAYMDKAYDTAHNHTWIDITHAVSTDAGKTWHNERVTTKSFDGDLGVHQDGFAFIGDYLGIDCAGMDCWIGFPDSHQGGVPVIAAAHVHMAS